MEQPLHSIGPSQLYLSSEKLADVVAWFDFETPNYDPLPAFKHEGQWYLADGHTRAFAAYLAGETSLRIEREENIRETDDFDVYLECLSWCEEAGIETIPDLRGRILSPESYQDKWIDRCQSLSTL
jgi:hypothetical protein